MQGKSSSLRRITVAPGVYRQSGSFVAGFTHPATGSWTTKKLAGVTTVSAAKKARAKLISDLHAGRVAAPSVVTLGAFAADWLAGREGRVRPRTFDADKRNVRIVTRRLGHVRLQEVDGCRLERFLQELRSGAATGNRLAERTVLQCYTTLRQVLDHAVVRDLIVVNPCTKVAKHLRPKATSVRKPNPLTPEEVERLLAAASPAYRPILAVCAFTGARIREVLGLRWGDVDAAAKLITFTHQIDEAGTRLVPIKTEAGERVNALVPALEPYLGREARMRSRWSGDTDFVFSTATSPRSRSTSGTPQSRSLPASTRTPSAHPPSRRHASRRRCERPASGTDGVPSMEEKRPKTSASLLGPCHATCANPCATRSALPMRKRKGPFYGVFLDGR
jgi:integrase